MDSMQPGQVIVPHEPDEKPLDDGAPKPERPAEQPEPAPSPGVVPEPSSPVYGGAATQEPVPTPMEAPAATATEPAAAEAAGSWQFSQESLTPESSRLEPPQDVSWTASEFIAHEKSASWYALLALGAVIVTVVVYVVTKDMISTGVVVLAAIAFGIFAARKPRTQQYSLTSQGIQIGQKFYGFQDFKTFSVSEEGAIASVVFAPMKRFMPPLTIYVAPDIEERVVDTLIAYLPFEEPKADAVDSLLKRIRF